MPLHFCPDCQNILTFAQQEQELIVRCRTCGYEGPCQETVLYSKNYRHTASQSSVNTNPDIIYDNTLKRTIHYECPNGSCITHSNADKKEAVFTRDNQSNLQQAMVCVACQTKWRI